jgi:hypothetical protein
MHPQRALQCQPTNLVLQLMLMESYLNRRDNRQVHKTKNGGTWKYLSFAPSRLVQVISIQVQHLQDDSAIYIHSIMQVAMCLLGHQINFMTQLVDALIEAYLFSAKF